jgi:hypothetical protein
MLGHGFQKSDKAQAISSARLKTMSVSEPHGSAGAALPRSDMEGGFILAAISFDAAR